MSARLEGETEQKPLGSGFGPQTTAEEALAGADLRGKVVVITGGHGGIGLETTCVLAKAGAAVVVGARDVVKARAVLEGLENVSASHLDLADPASIDRFAAEFVAGHRALDVLILNAGVMAAPLTRDARGNELQFSTNHLGHFRLTLRLREALERAGSARVISVSSAGHRFAPVDLEDPNFTARPYDRWKAYGQSKSANSLFAVELDRRGRERGIRSFAVHPGRIPSTELARFLSDEDLAKAGVRRVGGVYCADCDVSPVIADDSQDPAGVRRWAIDKPSARALWGLSERLTGVAWLR